MNKKNLLYFVTVLMLGSLSNACMDEKAPGSTWEYRGPVPEITNGPALAQKMCYDLYQKYDIHVYYHLSGYEALQTEVGHAQQNKMTSYNANAIPMQAADEMSAERFLTLLTGFYALLPDELVTRDLHRRHVLVKINPGMNKYKDENGKRYYSYTNDEDMQGVVFYGYLDSDEDTDNRLVSDVAGWKWSICYEFFRGLAYTTYKKIPLPEAFTSVSKGLYYGETGEGIEDCMDYQRNYKSLLGKKYGFVHPFGAAARHTFAYADWGSWVAWILTTPRAERETDLRTFERLKKKYEIVIRYYQEYHGLDLEQLAVKYQAITIG